MKALIAVTCLVTLFLVTSCTVEKVDYKPVDETGRLWVSVRHQVNGTPLQRNELIYTNEAGNVYLVSGLKYFISDITLYRDGKPSLLTGSGNSIFYIDAEVDSTMELVLPDRIPSGEFDSLSFVFGLPAGKNISHLFLNPPEALMGWPEVLGGGYHHMMLDGKWKDPAGVLQPFNCHLGTGQLYHGTGYNTDSIYAFVDNSFRVSLPGSAFTMPASDTTFLLLQMNIENWFRNPYTYDHNTFGGAIMQNQQAMQRIRDNGWNVFSVQVVGRDN